MITSKHSLIFLSRFSRELEKLGFLLKEEDEVKFVFERIVTNDAVLLYKNLCQTVLATANHSEVLAVFNSVFNAKDIEDIEDIENIEDIEDIENAEIHVTLENGDSFVDLVNRLNRITKSFNKNH